MCCLLLVILAVFCLIVLMGVALAIGHFIGIIFLIGLAIAVPIIATTRRNNQRRRW